MYLENFSQFLFCPSLLMVGLNFVGNGPWVVSEHVLFIGVYTQLTRKVFKSNFNYSDIFRLKNRLYTCSTHA